MDDCSCTPHYEYARNELGHVQTITHWTYDPMCLVHGQIGIS